MQRGDYVSITKRSSQAKGIIASMHYNPFSDDNHMCALVVLSKRNSLRYLNLQYRPLWDSVSLFYLQNGLQVRQDGKNSCFFQKKNQVPQDHQYKSNCQKGMLKNILAPGIPLYLLLERNQGMLTDLRKINKVIEIMEPLQPEHSPVMIPKNWKLIVDLKDLFFLLFHYN